ncbi:MAG: hypothetical protein NUV67_05275 [archaeon]|nr:hypothetical protein [archaeon]
MREKMKKTFLGALALFSAMLVFAGVAMAVPGMPHQFYGTVTINSEAAPNGTIVKAIVDGEEYTTTVVSGIYGQSPAETFFVQDPEPVNNKGKTIEFFVGTTSAATAQYADVTLCPDCGFSQLNIAITVEGEVPTPPETPPQTPTASAGGGGGGGGSGDPTESRLLRVSPAKAEVGEEFQFDALCKWNFGCFIETDGEQIAQMVKSSGFQAFRHVYDSEGEKTVRLYHSGTKPTLVSEKTVTVTEKIVETEVQEEPIIEEAGDNGQENIDDAQPPAQPLSTKENQDAIVATEETTTPTGFFGLGNFETGTNATAIGAIVLVILAIGIAFYFRQRKK